MTKLCNESQDSRNHYAKRKEVTVMNKLQILLCALLVVLLLAVPLVGCAKPLTLTVSQPKHGVTVTSSQVSVQGSVSDPKAIVTINNVKVSVSKKGYFSAKVTIKEGENTIKVLATRSKKSVSRTLTVYYSPSE